ncbi:HAD family hydrolase [Floccifex sp.]|uniref:HAD family hydrolase n=1 Tax=Floccifex sp. TaxID=2815810 RepID=UPI003F0F7C64
MKKNTIIFDMDGLLIDSERCTFEIYQQYLLNKNFSYSKEDYIQLLGKRKEFARNWFIQKYGSSFDFDKFWNETHILLDQKLTHSTVLKPGCIEVLKYAKEKGYTLLVATSSDSKRALSILKANHIDFYFDDFVFGDEVSSGKPNPEVFLKASQKVNKQSKEAYVLEDSETGIQAAIQAGIDVICIPDMVIPCQNIQNKCFAIVSQLKDFLIYL